MWKQKAWKGEMVLNGEEKENKFKLRKAKGWEMEMTQENIC